MKVPNLDFQWKTKNKDREDLMYFDDGYIPEPVQANSDCEKIPLGKIQIEIQNLISIYAAMSGITFNNALSLFIGKPTSNLKTELTQLLVEKVSPISKAFHSYLDDGVSYIQTVTKGWKGWLEDRRPNSAADPYKVAARIIKTVKTADLVLA